MQLLKIPIIWIILLVIVLAALFTGFAIANPEPARLIARLFFEILWAGILWIMGIKFFCFLIEQILGIPRD